MKIKAQNVIYEKVKTTEELLSNGDKIIFNNVSYTFLDVELRSLNEKIQELKKRMDLIDEINRTLYQKLDKQEEGLKNLNLAVEKLAAVLGIDTERNYSNWQKNEFNLEISDKLFKLGLLAKLVKLTKADEFELIEEQPETKIILKKKETKNE